MASRRLWRATTAPLFTVLAFCLAFVCAVSLNGVNLTTTTRAPATDGTDTFVISWTSITGTDQPTFLLRDVNVGSSFYFATISASLSGCESLIVSTGVNLNDITLLPICSTGLPASGNLIVTLTRFNSYSPACGTVLPYSLTANDTSTTLTPATTTADYEWPLCPPVDFTGASIAFAIVAGKPQLTVDWTAIASADSETAPTLQISMDQTLFATFADLPLALTNSDVTVTASLAVTTGPIKLAFTVPAGSSVPQSGTLVIPLTYLSGVLSCANSYTSTLTLASANAAATVAGTTLMASARNPACPALLGLTVEQKDVNKLYIAWTGISNVDGVTLEQAPANFLVAPWITNTTQYYTYSDARYPNVTVPVTGSTNTFAQMWGYESDLYVSFTQTDDTLAFPATGSVELEMVLSMYCGLISYQAFTPVFRSQGLTLQGDTAPFLGSSMPCISVFSGVTLTTPYADSTAAAVQAGSTGFRFAWTGLTSNRHDLTDIVRISLSDTTQNPPPVLLADTTSQLTAVISDAAGVIAGWTVTATVVDSVVSLSFAGVGSMPSAAWIDVVPARVSTQFPCDTHARFAVADIANVTTIAAATEGSLAATYVWSNCPIAFTNIKLVASQPSGDLQLAVTWTATTVASFNTLAPALVVQRASSSAPAVYADAWNATWSSADLGLSVNAESVNGVITLQFVLADGATVPASANVILSPSAHAVTESACPDMPAATVYELSSANTAFATVANPTPSLLTTSARAVACPVLSGAALAFDGHGAISVSWTGFTNVDGVLVSDFPSLTIAPAAGAVAVFTALAEAADNKHFVTGSTSKYFTVTFDAADNSFTLAFGETGLSTGDWPTTGTVTFDGVLSATCGLSTDYTLAFTDSDSENFSLQGSSSALTVAATSLVCFEYSGFSLAWVTQGVASATPTGFEISWTGVSSPDDEAALPVVLSLTAGDSDVIDALAASAATIDIGGGATASAALADGAITVTFTPATGAVLLPTKASFVVGVTLKMDLHLCGKTSQYTASSASTLAVEAGVGSLAADIAMDACPTPATFSGVYVETVTANDVFNFGIVWSGFVNTEGVPLVSSFRLAPPAAGSDAFDFTQTVTISLTDLATDTSVQGIAAVAIDAGAFVVSFSPTTTTAVPAQGRVMLTTALNPDAVCSTTTPYTLSSGDESAVALEPETVAPGADALVIDYVSPLCPSIFDGLKLTTEVQAAPASNKGFIVSWADFGNDDDVFLNNAFIITRMNTQNADPFTGVSANPVPVIDSTSGLPVTGASASLAYNSATGAITVSFDIDGINILPKKGLITVYPTLNTSLDCDSAIMFALTPNPAVAVATYSGTLEAQFSGAECTIVTGVDVTLTEAELTESTLELELTYATLSIGADAGTIKLSSTGLTNLYKDNSSLVITVSADGFATSTVTGSIVDGVITLPLSNELPTSMATMSFTLDFAVTSDCDLTTKLVPSADRFSVKMTLASGFSSLMTPGLACTFDWRCDGADSQGVPVAGLVCSRNDTSQFGACDTDCGVGARDNEPFCARLNNGVYAGGASNSSLCTEAEPAYTLPCQEYTCPDALWKCYSTTEADMVPCADNDGTGGFGTCASTSDNSCHYNPSLERVAVCVASANSLEDLGANCPSAVKSELAEIKLVKTCAPSLDGCQVVFNNQSPCYDADNKLVTCGTTATRVGVCMDNGEEAESINLCTLAGQQIHATCNNLPACGTDVAWMTTPSASCVTSSAPLCKSIITNSVQCGYVNSTTSETVVVADFVCDSQFKPPTYVNCGTPAVSCTPNQGTCSGFESYTVAGTTYDDVLATCVCRANYFDAGCSTSVSLSGLNATWDTATRGIKVYWTTNAVDTTNVKVSVLYTPPGFSAAVNTGDESIGDGYSFINGVHYRLAPGKHTVTVFLSPAVSASTTVVVGTLCDTDDANDYACENGGTCSSTTGQCACQGGWTGPFCEVSPCAAVSCNALNTESPSCSVVNNKAKCNCRTASNGDALFSDALCNVAVAKCAGVTCANGGVPSSTYDDDTDSTVCTEACACPVDSPFGGPLCDACNLACNPDGTVGSISSKCKCTCKAGYFDENCGCRVANLRLVFPQSAMPFLGATNEATQLVVWSAALQTDLKTAGGKPSVQFSVVNVRTVSAKKGKFANILIYAGPDCFAVSQKTAALPVAFAAHMARTRPMTPLTPAARFASRFTAQATVDMTETYTALQAIITALTTGQSTGATLSAADPSNIGVSDDACGSDCGNLPVGTGTGTVEATAKSSNTDDIIIGVVVGVGGFLIIVAIVLILWCNKCCCFASSGSSGSTTTGSKVATEDRNAGIEMTATGSTYDV